MLTLGLMVALRRLSRVRARQDFFTEFAERFMRYVNGGGQDEALYVELTQRVSRMQRELGHHGIMTMYRPPYANYAFRDYDIIVNMLPQYRQAAHDDILQLSQAPQYAHARPALTSRLQAKPCRSTRGSLLANISASCFLTRKMQPTNAG
jgi:hypothetical protein